MTQIKQKKWDNGVAVSKGQQAVSLLGTYKTDLLARLPNDFIEQFGANVAELAQRLSGQGSNLSEQKSSTSAQVETIANLNKRLVSIRGIVKAANASAEIKNAFGVGTRISPTVGSVSSAVKTVITAYSLYKQWCNSVGIIDKDIEEITAMETSLYSVDEKQEKNKYARKAATADKNTLNRAVEDEITRISALGVQEFEISKPAVAKQFADLIPSAPAKTKKADTQAAVQ